MGVIELPELWTDADFLPEPTPIMNHPVPEALHFIQPLCPECDTNYPMRRTNVCADCYAGIKPWKPARKR